MERFIWNDKYSIGINEIDEQHKHFFGLANIVIGLAEKGNASKEEVFNALNDLGNYAFYHFGIEEAYFDKFAYIDAPLHIALHNTYREAIAKYFSDMRKEGADVNKIAGEIASYSSNWLSEHILTTDIKYAKYFKEHGVV